MSRRGYVVAAVSAALAVPLVAATPATAAEASRARGPAPTRARVSSVIDGDSIRVRINGRSREVRLIGVAAVKRTCLLRLAGHEVRQVQAQRAVGHAADRRQARPERRQQAVRLRLRPGQPVQHQGDPGRLRQGAVVRPHLPAAVGVQGRRAHGEGPPRGSVGPLLTAGSPGGHRVARASSSARWTPRRSAELVELGAAGEAVGQHDGARRAGPAPRAAAAARRWPPRRRGGRAPRPSCRPGRSTRRAG